MQASSTSLYPAPRFPTFWAWALALSQVLVAVLWWRFGWRLGLSSMFLSHLLFAWGTFRPQSRLFGPVLARLPTRENAVWLTIDDGPSRDTLAILDALDAHDAKATFFLVGARAARHPELVGEIVRRGHGIGNHSATHPSRWFWALGPARIRREVAEAQRVLGEIARSEGVDPPRWFRAVVGFSNPFVAPALHAHGLMRVAWSTRGYDGIAGDPQAMLARIERGLAPGAIVLLHEGAPHGQNVDILRRLLETLDAAGYRTVLPQTWQT